MTIIKVPIHKVLSKGRELNEKLLSFKDTETEDKDLENLNELTKFNYYPKTRDELQELIYKLIEERGNKADLNDIYTGDIIDMADLFQDAIYFNGDISKWDVSNVEDMSYMFQESVFNNDISKWNVRNVKNMSGMFMHSSFNGDISKWDVSNVEDMPYVFNESNFNGDISNWDISKVRDMYAMFYHSAFNGDISKWNVSNVEDMGYMFANSIFNGDISNWNVSNVRTMPYMFYRSDFNGDISKWDVSNVENMRFMFYESKFKGDISKWNVKPECNTNNANFPRKKVNEKLLSFEDTETENKDLENFNKVSEIAERKKWFEENCKALPESEHEKSFLYSSTGFQEFDKKYIAFAYVSDKPNNFKGFEKNKNNVNIIDRNTYKIISENEWFSDIEFNSIIADSQNKKHLFPVCVVKQRTINSYDMTEECYNFLNLETGNLLSPTLWFDNCGWYWPISQKMNGKQTTTVTFSAELYEHLNSYIDIREIGEINFKINEDGEFYTSSIFEGHNKSYERISVDEIKKVLGFKDLSFDGCHDFINFRKYCITESKEVNEKLLSFEDKDSEDTEIENFNFISTYNYSPKTIEELKELVEKLIEERGNNANLNDIYTGDITDMHNLFAFSDFNGDISKWDVSNVKNMHSMFERSKFNGDISNWDVSRVKDMSYMFYNNSHFNGDISNWDVSNVKSMYAMFFGSSFNGDISKWNIYPDCDTKNANFPRKKVNEKLLSFEDKETEDNDLENLTKVNNIANFEANYSIISDDFMNDELNVLGKKQGFFIVYHNKRSKLNAVPNQNVISSKTYELVSPDIWFSSVESEESILKRGSYLKYNLLPVSVLVVNEHGLIENKCNFLNLETGKLLFPNIWFDYILSEGFITAVPGHFNENEPTVSILDLCQCVILSTIYITQNKYNLNLYVSKDGKLYVRERTGNREDPYPTYVNMTAEEIIKKYHLEQYDIAPVSKSNYIKEQDINEKLLTFNDEDEDKEAEELDNLFVLGNLETQKPKMIQWFLNYGLNLNDVVFETFNNDPVISVNGDLDLSGKGITRLPWPFYKISGSFNISNNKLTSCNNLPMHVGGRMNINNNFIKSFEGLPTRYVGVTLEANHQKCKTAYPLTNENAQIYMKNGSDAELKKNRVKVRINEDFEYGTICGINESETMAEVLLDDHDKSEMFNVEDVYPLEQDLL